MGVFMVYVTSTFSCPMIMPIIAVTFMAAYHFYSLYANIYTVYSHHFIDMNKVNVKRNNDKE